MSDKSEASIRPAGPMDSVNVVRLIKEGWKETPAAQISPLNEQRLLEYVTSTLRHSFCIVAEKNGRTLGTLAVAPIRMPWCETVVMAESWFCVVPKYRDRALPGQMLRVLDKFLDTQKLPAILGTQVLAPSQFNALLSGRAGYLESRTTFVRLPGRAFMPPKAVSA